MNLETLAITPVAFSHIFISISTLYYDIHEQNGKY